MCMDQEPQNVFGGVVLGMTDCGIVEIHVLGEPLLGHELLIELDVRLCEQVVLGLITCVGEGLVSRPPSSWRSAQGI